uniref:Uncharacterized protein n=1 Tax=Romanomermis culicivorax TaxID=13658 RepID=A0A915JSA7_ROMCU
VLDEIGAVASLRQLASSPIGFGDVALNFAKFRVDGDLLLRTRDENLINEIGLNSKYERMRFERELKSLK